MKHDVNKDPRSSRKQTRTDKISGLQKVGVSTGKDFHTMNFFYDQIRKRYMKSEYQKANIQWLLRRVKIFSV